MNALVRVNPAQENQIITAGLLKGVERKIDSVVDGRQIIQARRTIRIADGNKISVTILLINGHDFVRREAVDGGKDRSLDQAGVGQSHEVVVAVNEVKLTSTLERIGDVKVFGYLGIEAGILFISPVHYSLQPSARHRIPGRKQGHIPATGDKPFGDIARHRFPSTVLSR